MKKFKGVKRGFSDKETGKGEQPGDSDPDDSVDYASMAIGATAKKKKPKPDELQPKASKKKMPDAAKKALKLAIKAKLKKKAKPDESE